MNLQNQTDVPHYMKCDLAYITTGYYHSCAITAKGRGDCWGHNKAGQSDIPFAMVHKLR